MAIKVGSGYARGLTPPPKTVFTAPVKNRADVLRTATAAPVPALQPKAGVPKPAPAPRPQEPLTKPTVALGSPTSGLSDEVVDSIMRSEGDRAIQSGVQEMYGFRAKENTGFKEIKAAVDKYGHKSPEVRSVVAGLLRKRASSAGAHHFSDAGVQASVMSMAHMRGEGGSRAILGVVAGMPVTKSRDRLDKDTIQKLNAMDPEEFQRKLRKARETYDRTIYGDRIDSYTTKSGKTVKGRWWDLFGEGLVKRYDREFEEFVRVSKSARKKRFGETDKGPYIAGSY